MPLKLHLRLRDCGHQPRRPDLSHPAPSLPVVNWLQWCLVLQTHFWPITSCHVVTTLGESSREKRRRVEFPRHRMMCRDQPGSERDHWSVPRSVT